MAMRANGNRPWKMTKLTLPEENADDKRESCQGGLLQRPEYADEVTHHIRLVRLGCLGREPLG